MRKRIFEIIEKTDGNDKPSLVYDICMIVVIVISLIPLAFKQENTPLIVMDKVTVAIFIVDYILRWATADYKFDNPSVLSIV